MTNEKAEHLPEACVGGQQREATYESNCLVGRRPKGARPGSPIKNGFLWCGAESFAHKRLKKKPRKRQRVVAESRRTNYAMVKPVGTSLKARNSFGLSALSGGIKKTIRERILGATPQT